MGLTKQDLETTVDDEVSKTISSKLDQNWECLATSIGVADDIVHDVKLTKSSNFPLALLTRWKQLYGSEATYHILIKGLDQIGRRDLTEKVLDFKCIAKAPKKSASFIERRKFTATFILLLVVTAVVSGLLLLLIASGKVFFTIFNDTLYRDDFHVIDYSSMPDVYFDNDTCSKSHDILCKHFVPRSDQNISPCTNVYSNLPNIQWNVFIGRENDTTEIMRKVQDAHIVSVSGAPGFGKSSVVIHTGYKLVQNGISVRYLDVEQEIPRVHVESAYEYHDPNKASAYHRKSIRKNTTAILKTIRSITGTHGRGKAGVSKLNNTIEELILWSKQVECFTVLILDNCDDILSSEVRDDFIDLVNFLVQNSNNLIHVIVVAQAKLLLLDNFLQWTVRELSIKDSVELLQKMVPGVEQSQAELISNLVERCPLALKVVGSILHLNGGDFLTKKLETELQDDPIGVLDRPDYREDQFRTIMDLALSRFSEMMNNECDYSVSLFPGTFTWEAGHSVLPQAGVCLDVFVKYSLLDEYLHGYLHRYRMHRLIREFLLEKVTFAETTRFNRRFSNYFESFVLQYVEGNFHQLDEIEEYVLKLETQNIQYFLDLLISQENRLTPKQLVILSYGFNKDLTSFASLKPHFTAFMRSMTDVCLYIDTDPDLCGKLYSKIIQHFYSECKCRDVSQYLGHLMNSHCPCTSTDEIFQCETVYEINSTESIWVLLPTPVQEYIERIMLYNCYHSHVFASNSLSVLILFVMSVVIKSIRKRTKVILSIMIYIIVGILHTIYQVSWEIRTTVIVEVFLKIMCHRLLFLVLLFMLLCFVHTFLQILIITITLMFFYFVMTYLWSGTTYPLQGCDFLPLCY